MTANIAIGVVGEFFHPVHEESIAHHLGICGARVTRLPIPYDGPMPIWSPSKWQRRFYVQGYFAGIRRLLLATIEAKHRSGEKWDALLFYRCRWIDHETLRSLRRVVGAQCILAEYNVDNAFSPRYDPRFWKSYNKSLSEFDVCFSIRPNTLTEFESVGCRRVELLPHLVPDRDFDLGIAGSLRTTDLAFIGHFENDLRGACLKALFDAGLGVQIFGPLWDRANDPRLRAAAGQLSYSEYLTKLSDCKAALCFLSTLNNDVYTNRVFEIPARGACLISIYRREIEKIYGEDVLYFSTPEECVKAVRKFQSLPAMEIEAMRRRSHNKAAALFRSSVGAARVLEVLEGIRLNGYDSGMSPYSFLLGTA